MAKSLRSKVKRVWRAQRGRTVADAPATVQAEERKQEGLQAALSAPSYPAADPAAPAAAAAVPADGPASMDADGNAQALPELTTQNPAKLARKLKARRLAASRGLNPALKKRGSALAGANQFHKGKKKGQRKNRR